MARSAQVQRRLRYALSLSALVVASALSAATSPTAAKPTAFTESQSALVVSEPGQILTFPISTPFRALPRPSPLTSPAAPAEPIAPAPKAADTPSSVSPAAPPVPSSCMPDRAIRLNTSGPGKRVSLTFDDGPGRDTTAVLDILESEDVRATFFMLGSQVQSNAAVVHRMVREGHDLGNHSWDHPQLRHLGSGTQARQLDRTTTVIERVSGRPLCLFRPPYGEHNAVTDRLTQRRHLETVIWSVDTEDWKAGPAARSRARAITADAGAHPIVLFHDGGGDRRNTVANLRSVIRHYKTLGYRFTRVDGIDF